MKNLPLAVLLTPLVLLGIGVALYFLGYGEHLEVFPKIFYVLPGLSLTIPGALFAIYFLVFKKDQEALLESIVLFSVGAMIAWLNPLFGFLAVGILFWRKHEAQAVGAEQSRQEGTPGKCPPANHSEAVVSRSA